jgi:hypothetical protein
MPITRNASTEFPTTESGSNAREAAVSAPESHPGKKQIPASLSALSEIGHKSGTDLNASPRRRRTSSLSEADRRLASYLFARSVDRRPPDLDELKMLKEGHASVEEARRLLPWGRGNVESDLTRTKNESLYRAWAMRSMAPLGLHPVQRAALAVYAGGGNCGEHADVVMHVHAAKLAIGDRLHDVNNPGGDHAAVIHEGGGERPDIVLDAWGNIGALNVRDSKYHGDSRDLETIYTYTSDIGETATEQFYRNVQQVNSDEHDKFDSELERVRSLNIKSVGSRDSNVVEEGFARRISERISSTDPAINHVNAVNAARSIGASERAAVRAAPMIIDDAANMTRGN